MTCKDCIHNEVCSQFSKVDGANHEYYTYTNMSEKCECFKCKSEFVHIPCNIGSAVYFVDVEFNADTKNFEPKIYKTVVDSYTANKFYTLYHTRRGNDFTDSMLGRTVFITREEAKKALLEMSAKQ